MTLTQRIKEDWGTVKHFCRKNDINYNSLRAAMNGVPYYTAITQKLIDMGYINSPEEITQKQLLKPADQEASQ